MSADSSVEFRAQAEDGAVIRVLIQGQAPDSLAAYFPGRGLVETGVQDEPEETLELELVSDLGQAYLESSLGLFAASHLNHQVAIHAGLIRADEQLIVLPAPSLSGKTSMCVAARDAGFQVLGDEYVLVDPASGLIQTWPRPMRIREGRTWRKEPLDLESGPLQATLVAVLRFDERASESSSEPLTVRALSPGELAVELISNMLCAQLRPDDALAAAMAIARQTRGVIGTRAEAGPALQALLSLES